MDDQHHDNGQRPAPSRRGPFLQAALWFFLGLCLAAALWMGFTLFSISEKTEPSALQEKISESAANSNATDSPGTQSFFPKPAHTQFEETPESGLEAAIRHIDKTLLDTLRSKGVNATDVNVVSVQRRASDQGEYFHQVIRLDSSHTDADFMQDLQTALHKAVPQASLAQDGYGKWRIALENLPTHELLFSHAPLPEPPSIAQAHRLVLVIDDMGENMQLARRLAALDVPVTFAVWPRASHTNATCSLARNNNLEILIHQPMEPLSYPKADPGPGALFVNMPDVVIQAMVADNIARVPGATGMNNHMGSRFTEDEHKMKDVLSVLRKHGLFFLDSATTPRSAVRGAAKRIGMPYVRRQVFLDNQTEVGAIRLQLEKAEKLALHHGQAIAIGHPHPETVQAIEEWLPTKNTTIELTRVRNLLPAPVEPPKKTTNSSSRD
jgi:polysaccharide deacetylase 2 family uncharacterized protein YibQ